MKISLSAIASSLLLAAAILSFASCQDEDFGFTKEDVVKGKYAREFAQMFGEFPADFSWDLTDGPLNGSYHDNQGALTRSAVPESELVRANANELRSNGKWYQLEQGTTAWLNKNLVEGRDNRGLGKEFIMNTPKNDFKIIPIFQGVAEMKWDLHIVTEKGGKYYDYNIWSKSHGLRYKKKGGSYVNFASAPSEFDDQGNCSLIGKQGIEGQEMTIDHTKLGETFYFYLDITQGSVKEPNSSHHNYKSPSDIAGQTTSNGTPYSFWTNPYNNFAYPMTKQWSDDHMMLALKCPFPTNLGLTGVQPNMALIIGCEDADQRDSDHDMNDVVFLIVGEPDVPDVIELTRKRYMIEDLGGTFDFDFNDVVVDVTQSVHKNILTGEVTKTTQDAEIVAMCGTIPFQVNIGSWSSGIINRDKTSVPDPGVHSPRITNMKYTNLDGNPWDPEQNNISINVYANGKDVEATDFSTTNTNNVYTVNFPGSDETFMTTKTPMIIAVHQTQDWKPETETIDASWWEHRLQPTEPTVTAPTTTDHNTIGYSRDDIFEDAEGNLHANLIPALNGTGVVEVTGATSSKTTATSVTASFSALGEAAPWAHMIKIHTGKAVAANERYDLRFKITSTQPLGENPIVKLEQPGGGDAPLLDATQLKMIYAGGSEYWFVFTDLNKDLNKTLTTLDIVLDFRNTIEAEVTVSDVMLQEVPSSQITLHSSNWSRGGITLDESTSVTEDGNYGKYYYRYEPEAKLQSAATSDNAFSFWLDEKTKYTYTADPYTFTVNESDLIYKVVYNHGVNNTPLADLNSLQNKFTKITGFWNDPNGQVSATKVNYDGKSAYSEMSEVVTKNSIVCYGTDAALEKNHKYDFYCKVYTNHKFTNTNVNLLLKKESADQYLLNDRGRGITMGTGAQEYWLTFTDLEWVYDNTTMQIQMEFGGTESAGTFIRISDIYLVDKGTIESLSVSEAAPVPTRPASQVISLYSDSYDQAVAMDKALAWDGTTQTKSDVAINGNNYLQYSNFRVLGWNGAPTDVSNMKYLHVDIYPRTTGTMQIFPIYGGGGKTTDDKHYKIVEVTANQWNQIDIDLSELDYIENHTESLDLTSIFQMKFESPAGSSISEFALDNVYFWTDVAPAFVPSSAAPTPDKAANKVISIYSDKYARYTGSFQDNYDTRWWQEQTTTKTDGAVGDNHYMRYSNFNLLGWQLNPATPINASAMEYLHLDIYPKQSGSMDIYVIYGGDGKTTDDSHKKNVSLTANQWNSINIPLSELTGLNMSSIHQMKFVKVSDVDEFCVDNVYFWTNSVFAYPSRNMLNASAITGTGSWYNDANNTVQIDGSFSPQYSFTLGQATNSQWDAQVYFNTNVTVEQGKKYDYRVKVFMSKPFQDGKNQNAQIKIQHATNTSGDPYLCQTFRPRLENGLIVSEGNSEYVEFIGVTAGATIENVKLYFDFGGNAAGAEIRISEMWLQEHQE